MPPAVSAPVETLVPIVETAVGEWNVPSEADSVQEVPAGTLLAVQLRYETPPLSTLVGLAVNEEIVGGTAAGATCTITSARGRSAGRAPARPPPGCSRRGSRR